MKARERAGVFLALALSAAALLLAFSGSSPLYPTNPWNDVNCFMTVAEGWTKGLIPYRDLIEQKGPLLYLLHLPAAGLFGQSFIGVYLLEALAMALFLYISWRTLSLFIAEKHWPMLIPVCAVLLASKCFAWGDSAEELCLPLLAWSLYDALRHFSGAGEIGYKRAALNGVLAGCVLWIKFSLLGLHFAWMAVIAIECVVRRRSVGRAAGLCAAFLAGMALTALPWLIYFGANGALDDLWEIYFLQNIFGYAKRGNLLKSFIKGALGGALSNPSMTALSLLGGLHLILGRNERKNGWRTAALAAMALCTLFFAYCGGRSYPYYYFVSACFVPLGCVPLGKWLVREGEKRGFLRRASAALALLILVGLPLATNQNIRCIGYPKRELVQTRFAERMRADSSATMLNYGMLDGGFYRAADILPCNRWFCGLNANPKLCKAEQDGIIERGGVDFVVTKKPLSEYGVDASRYELVDQAVEEFNYRQRGTIFYLYRRTD